MSGREKLNSFLFTLFGFQKAKSRAHIALVVLIHATGWCVLFFLPLFLYPVRINEERFLLRELVDKSVLIALFYLNYYFLIPRFFEKRKYLRYAVALAAVFLFYLGQHVFVRVHYFPRRGAIQFVQFLSPVNPREDSARRDVIMSGPGLAYYSPVARRDSPRRRHFFTRPLVAGDTVRGALPNLPRFPEPEWWGIPRGAWMMMLSNAISSFTFLMLLGGFIRLAFSLIRNQNEKKALENANLNAEVKFLKSQINPHFLFNTLNSIYAQAHSRSANTEFSILKLSELLRYVLYDSGEPKVELARDIQYINNYIDLQKMRLSSKVRIDYTVEGHPSGCKIAPLLLITFIENAFKHGISYSQPSVINITIRVFEETLTLHTSNPLVEKNSFAGGGIGLKNVTRRLDLLYPGKYRLDIHDNDDLHIVNLKLDLKSD